MLLNLCLYGIAFYYQTDKLTDLTFSFTIFSISALGFMYSAHGLLDIIIFLLVTIWSIRLGSYLFRRVHKIGRDKRFDAMRSSPLSFLGFWIIQGISCFIMTVPVISIYLASPAEIYLGSYLGVAVAIVGLVLETIADRQKYRFKNKQPDDFMQSGVWKYIRHPNYTGELLFWWGIALVVINATSMWWHSVGAIWITVLILFISGIPLLDISWQRRYGHVESFKKYRARSYNLIPFLY